MTAFISVLVVMGLYNRMRSGDTLISVPRRLILCVMVW